VNADNFLKTRYAISAEELLADKTQLLTQIAPKETVLVGGMRVLKTNFGGSQHDLFTKRTTALTDDFFRESGRHEDDAGGN
jgi:catalase-peroxidase